MRDRHFPRLCRTCDAPMARQADTCWHCGAQWVHKTDTTGNPPAAPGAARAKRNPPAAPGAARAKRNPPAATGAADDAGASQGAALAGAAATD